MQLEQLIGQTLAIGIPGKKITPEIVQHFKDLNAGGLILYRINFDNPRQLKKLITDLENALERKLLIMADHEGGRVIMFRDGITVFPDNLAIGTTGKVEYARFQGEIEAKELRRLGMDINLGPDLDVLTQLYSPNIGIRAYGTNWKQVAEMGVARIRASQDNGVSACAKHFPGKGHAPVDAHLSLPTIQSTWKEMEETHLKPFVAAIEAGVDLVMSSHPYYPKLDADPKHIATFSRKIVGDYLRKTLRYEGVIMSDDLEMGAIKEICSIGEAGVRSMEAGHDILLVCHDLNAQKEVYRGLVDAYKSKQLSVKELEASVERLDKLKAQREERFESGAPKPERNGSRIAAQICEEAVTLHNVVPARLPKLKGSKILAVFPQFSSLDPKIMIEKVMVKEKKFIADEFKKFKLRPKTVVVGIEPADEEIAEAVKASQQADFTFLFCYDAHLYPSNKKLLDGIQAAAKNCAIVLLRDPYDLEFVQKDIPAVTCFGWRACQIRACIAKICNR